MFVSRLFGLCGRTSFVPIPCAIQNSFPYQNLKTSVKGLGFSCRSTHYKGAMTNPMDLHIFFLPFLSPGNMIPMVDIAKLFACRGVKATIVTTSGNVHRIKPTLNCCPCPVQLLTIPFPSSVTQDFSALDNPQLTPELLDAIDSLEQPFGRLLEEHNPDCIISDACYPWSADLAVAHGIPRIVFCGSSAFCGVANAAIFRFNPHEGLADDESFLMPGIPHQIRMIKSQILTLDARSATYNVIMRMAGSQNRSYGSILNTCYQLEPGYTDNFHNKTWLLGPVSLCSRDTLETATRGGKGHDMSDCLNWLDDKKKGSVLYVCFGSMGRFTCLQLREMAAGLEASGHPFLWVMKNTGDTSEWMPTGFEERVVGEWKGMIIRGWAPQVAILNHKAIGGFMTHCGWNSCLEGMSYGVPMITWPLFSDQFCNERLLVDVLKIGVAVRSNICSWRAEERTLVSSGEVTSAVNELMGNGDDADERRKRAREAAATAWKAMEEGGSSYNDMSSLIQELIDVKSKKN